MEDRLSLPCMLRGGSAADASALVGLLKSGLLVKLGLLVKSGLLSAAALVTRALNLLPKHEMLGIGEL